MFLVARVTNAQWFQCPLPIISHRLKPKLPSLLYNAKFYRFNKLSYSLDKESDDFLLWLERKAGTHVSSILSIGKSSYGRALYASKVIRTGDCILRVPYKVQLAPDNLPYEIKSLLTDEIGHVAKLAIVVLLEMKLEKHSDWVPYISYFPCLKDMHSTIFWSNDELEMIRQSSLYHETIHQKSLVKNEFLTIKNAIERYEIFESITYKDFMHAYALVSSRAWGSIRGVSLIPFADFLNHDGNVEAFLLNDDEKQLSEVIADRDYCLGEQIHIQFEIPHHDPLRRMKLEIMQRHHVVVKRDVNAFISSVDSFSIKEVRSSSQKGKGLPQSLRAFARVLCCCSPQELNDLAIEAKQTDGRLARRPLRNIEKEIEAHHILVAQTSRLIKEYEASIKSLDAGNSSSSLVRETLGIRRQMAQDLLNGELRVLKSASTWLKSYCTTLITTS
ncbi:fructose-bisphosphate aldolase-lysine N-methyltransferase, chloroplastic isoform X2 [Humulus lupulus]|uniref:fructose-bisphosphate aldolase-lysine N-methyltransferase, chloroplastic isoform X2 n=1 Tax=Humulus lupulus TaxID=3486 RepID=UPI002B408917|nr:fructose-bisphosphate aldolase-lysine N-methyltransferase, chloroplastic isoform X2 [Humulus lupulus]